MHTVQLKIDSSIYENVMFLLNGLKLKGLEIKEQKVNLFSDEKNSSLDFSKYEIKAFKDIKDPLQWQKDLRNEWD